MRAVDATAETVLDRLREREDGARLLDALDGIEGVHLVGGAVRDLLLGTEPRDLDLVAESDGVPVAEALAGRLGGSVLRHSRFGTASVEGAGLNVATARAESYARPGALPDVRPGSMAEDLARRDFTVNAIAVGVSPDRLGSVQQAPGASDDLVAERLRVLHDASFLDDPTRLVRLARYAARLGFVADEHTFALARAAFAAGAPETAGRARMGAELLLALREPDPVAALRALRELAGEAPLDPGLEVDEALLRRAAALHPDDPLVLLAALARRSDRSALAQWLTDIHLSEAGVVLDATADPDELAQAMREAGRPSDLWRLLRRRTPQAAALAGALGAEERAREWLGGLRDVRLAIGGEDLLRAGVPQGPEIGRRLDAALARKLDEGLSTREEELAAALEAPL